MAKKGNRIENFVKARRKERGLTQQQVADHFKVHVKTYRKWENKLTAERLLDLELYLGFKILLLKSEDFQ